MNEMSSAMTNAEDFEVEVKPARKPRFKVTPKARRTGLMLSVPLLIAAVFLYFWLTSGHSVSTDNAAIKQDIVSVSAQVVGPVSEVAVNDGDTVKRGDLLFRIDPAPFRVALEQAQAQLAAAELQTHQLRTQSAGTGSDIVGARADLEIQQRALGRQVSLLKNGFTTRADYDDAMAEVRKAETVLADAEARSANAKSAIASGEQPSIAAARAAIDKARVDLARTEVRAPFDGIIANSDRLQVGQAVAPGVGLLSLVHGTGAWVEANFKEKDLARMLPGESATIKIDAYGGQAFKGHVESIGAGTGSEFSVIPAQNANGNWVKVTQRVPVRIVFEGTPSRPMIAGLSAYVTVDLDSAR